MHLIEEAIEICKLCIASRSICRFFWTQRIIGGKHIHTTDPASADGGKVTTGRVVALGSAPRAGPSAPPPVFISACKLQCTRANNNFSVRASCMVRGQWPCRSPITYVLVSCAFVRFLFAVGKQRDHAALVQRVPVVVHPTHLHDSSMLMNAYNDSVALRHV